MVMSTAMASMCGDADIWMMSFSSHCVLGAAHSATRSDNWSRRRMLVWNGVSPGTSGGAKPQKSISRTRRRVSGTGLSKSAGEDTMPSRDCVLERSMSLSGARAGARDAHMRLQSGVPCAQTERPLAPAEVLRNLCVAMLGEPELPIEISRVRAARTLRRRRPRRKTLFRRRCRLTEAPYPHHDGGG